MVHRFTRTEALIGQAGLAKLRESAVAVFGLGGVGSYAAEALARAGVGNLILIDGAVIDITNVNRQIHALDLTVGQFKVDIMQERINAINPQAVVEAIAAYYTAETGNAFWGRHFDYVVDAIDSVSAKVDLIRRAHGLDIPLVASMGAGNKLDPAQFRIADIADTHTCPLAKAVRTRLRKSGITEGVKVVFSPEKPRRPVADSADAAVRQIPASISFVPPVAGLLLAGAVVNDLLAGILPSA
ncbi:MAG: tRNA threonylcarbamoyladenosine dehydratase [bacterium]|jgi:tRNA A37 threonylcarbamoyladenosine dehydratase